MFRRVTEWEVALKDYPDLGLQDYILNGLSVGFRVGYHLPRSCLVSAGLNLSYLSSNPTSVEEYLAQECALGRMLGIRR